MAPPKQTANIELKARRRSLRADRQVCKALGARPKGVIKQRDTYFVVKRGRFKLREQEPGRAELIAYLRPDESGPRLCNYFVIPVRDPVPVKALLGSCLGVLAEVRKNRELYLWRGVRIHLDRVKGLGLFLEFEAVLTRGRDARWGHRMVAKLKEAFGISSGDLIPTSYLELTLSERNFSAKDSRKGGGPS